MGTAGFINFDLANKASGIILFDINNNQHDFWKSVIEILKQSDSRFEFVQKFYKHMREDMFRRPGGARGKKGWYENYLLDELNHTSGWLGSDASFNRIKALAVQDKIIPLTLDIMDTRRWKDLASALENNAIILDTIYLSNLLEFDEVEFYGRAINGSNITAAVKAISDLRYAPEIYIGEHGAIHSETLQQFFKRETQVASRA